MMNSKILAAAAFTAALVPAVASAQGGYGATSQPVEARNPGIADRASTFVTNVLIPRDDGRPYVAYADNPDLIGHRHGATNPAWRK